MADKDKVNLSEDYELNYILKKHEKRQTEENRKNLIEIAKKMKKETGSKQTDRDELEKVLKNKKNLNKLEDKK